MACSRDQKTILQCPKEVAYCTFEIGVDLGKEGEIFTDFYY